MVFKAYSVQTLTEATSFVQDLKLGHYVKVPPRATFVVQMVATTLAAFVQVGVKTWIFKSIQDICDPNQSSQLTCPHNQVFFTASAVWSVLSSFFLSCFSFFFFFAQGSHWTFKTIWLRIHLSSSTLRDHRWCFSAPAVLVFAAEIPSFVDQVGIDACDTEWGVEYPACDWD